MPDKNPTDIYLESIGFTGLTSAQADATGNTNATQSTLATPEPLTETTPGWDVETMLREFRLPDDL